MALGQRHLERVGVPDPHSVLLAELEGEPDRALRLVDLGERCHLDVLALLLRALTQLLEARSTSTGPASDDEATNDTSGGARMARILTGTRALVMSRALPALMHRHGVRDGNHASIEWSECWRGGTARADRIT